MRTRCICAVKGSLRQILQIRITCCIICRSIRQHQNRGLRMRRKSRMSMNRALCCIIRISARFRQSMFRSVRFETAEEAQHAPAPITSYSQFYDGEFVTNEMLSAANFAKILVEKGCQDNYVRPKIPTAFFGKNTANHMCSSTKQFHKTPPHLNHPIEQPNLHME